MMPKRKNLSLACVLLGSISGTATIFFTLMSFYLSVFFFSFFSPFSFVDYITMQIVDEAIGVFCRFTFFLV